MEHITLITSATSGMHPRALSQSNFEIIPTTNASVLTVPLISLNPERSKECWQLSVTGDLGKDNNLNLYQTGEWLLGWAQWPIASVASITSDIRSLYQDWCNIASTRGYPHLLRTWTYLPNITHELSAGTRYQQFCEGRFQAYKDTGKKTVFPAATVVGASKDNFIQLFLSHQNAGVSIENPRQTNAFEYPVDHPDHAPLFSRALLHKSEQHAYLFISGTASIIDHETQHSGDVNAQLLEALTNIEVLINLAVKQHQFKETSLSNFTQVKVFIKRAEDYPLIRSLMEQRFGTNANIIYLCANMCRSDLLVEIEATCLTQRN